MIQGTVESRRDVASSYPNRAPWQKITIGGIEYGTQDKAPRVSVGTMVAFNVKPSADGRFQNAVDLIILNAQPGLPVTMPPPAPVPAGVGLPDAPRAVNPGLVGSDKDRSIVRQTSGKIAGEILVGMMKESEEKYSADQAFITWATLAERINGILWDGFGKEVEK